ncbi:MAG: TIGR04013 family B12-binding domain/radical SAM domain-containing protein [Myxococcota bacterium]|jgi:B12-binding domain/radical SAM domain protein|nr:TIGR04013 family B12-binding domain/radical SAM domain-containing protein [Myxococcota bacterium]
MKMVFLKSPRNRNSIAVLERVLRSSGLRISTRAETTVPTDLDERDIFAFSFTTTDLDAVVEVLRPILLGPRRPLLLAGGAHATADPDGTLSLGFDAVFVGEAEHTLPQFLRAWTDDPSRKRVQEDPIVRPGEPYDLNSETHADESTAQFPFLEISRGCPYACAFCQVPMAFGRRMRFRGPAMSAAGVAHAVARGHRRIRCLTSDAFAYGGGGPAQVAASLESLALACREAGADYLMLGNFPSEVRPDRVCPELLGVLVRHCANPTVVVGVQSGSDAVLCAMRRGHTVQESVSAVSLIREAGLMPHVDLLLGFPGETSADRRATLELALWVLSLPSSRLHLHVYLPLPGTPAWPAEPEALEPQVIARLRQLVATGRVDGYWDQQIAQGKRILAQRRSGLIHCR